MNQMFYDIASHDRVINLAFHNECSHGDEACVRGLEVKRSTLQASLHQTRTAGSALEQNLRPKFARLLPSQSLGFRCVSIQLTVILPCRLLPPIGQQLDNFDLPPSLPGAERSPLANANQPDQGAGC
ncbi:hypothetical protein ABVT39_013383 [Epinephelus coioides]